MSCRTLVRQPLTYSLNVHLGQPQPSAPSLLAHQSTRGLSLTALFWQPEGTKGKAAAYRWRLAHLQADRDSSGNLKINSRLCKKRAEPQKKDSSPLFRSLERALEKRGSDLRVPAASILFLTRFLYPSSQLFYQFHRHYRLLNHILSCPFPCRKNLIKGVFEYDSTYFIALVRSLRCPQLL